MTPEAHTGEQPQPRVSPSRRKREPGGLCGAEVRCKRCRRASLRSSIPRPPTLCEGKADCERGVALARPLPRSLHRTDKAYCHAQIGHCLPSVTLATARWGVAGLNHS